MKAFGKILLAFVSLAAVSEAHAMRWYSPSTGRWLSRDPLEEAGGLNLYGFVANNSVNHIDPYGLDRNALPFAICDLCALGPKLGGSTKTLRDWRWHVWGRGWQENKIQIFYPGTDIALTPPYHVPLSGGYWIIAGGWVVVDATCGIPKNEWTLSAFIVTDWPSIGPHMKPSVKCLYTCDYGKNRTASLPGNGAMLRSPPLQREDSMSEKDGPPPPFW